MESQAREFEAWKQREQERMRVRSENLSDRTIINP